MVSEEEFFFIFHGRKQVLLSDVLNQGATTLDRPIGF